MNRRTRHLVVAAVAVLTATIAKWRLAGHTRAGRAASEATVPRPRDAPSPPTSPS